MMPFEQFPYTNFHELNDDWIIKTVKEVKDKAENIDASVEEADAAAEAAKTSELNAKNSEDISVNAANQLSALYAPLSEQVNTNTNDIAVNSARIDTFTNLPSGSTAGDAELMDIRVGADGITYPTAGDAVRDQITALNDVVFGTRTTISPGSPTTNSYYRIINTNQIDLTSGSGSYYQPIDLTAYIGKTVRVSYTSTATTSTRVCALGNSTGNASDYVEELNMITNGFHDFDVSTDYHFLYISYSIYGSNLNVYSIEDSINEIPLQTVYVSTSGSDANSGKEAAPFRTIQKAVDSGALTIMVEAGTYSCFKIQNRNTPVTIKLKSMPAYNQLVTDVPKIVVTTAGTSEWYGVYAINCNEINISDMYANNTAYDCYYFNNVNQVNMTRCYASDTQNANSDGFKLLNVNGRFIDCMAWSVHRDGFNIHGYGDTQFINCIGHDCGDDGISHHDSTTGFIIGGEYYNNAKGGVSSPYSGAKIDVQGVYIHNNTQYGVYAGSPGGGVRTVNFKLSNCVIKNNTSYDIALFNIDCIGWNNIYDTKTLLNTATFTEY